MLAFADASNIPASLISLADSIRGRFPFYRHNKLSQSHSVELKTKASAMAAVSKASSPLIQFHKNYLSLNGSTSILLSLSYGVTPPHVCALAVASEGGRMGSQDFYGPDLLKRPVVSKPSGEEGRRKEVDGEEIEGEKSRAKWVDWEDQILDETVPLVGLVRMILHSGRYKSGEKLDPQHQKTIIEKLLPYHPSYETKRGCGIDYITVDYHPDYQGTRCLFIVRTDGEMVDFSYRKCLKGLIRKKYPMFADTFILRHFQRCRFDKKIKGSSNNK